jgi:hypothetical protein
MEAVIRKPTDRDIDRLFSIAFWTIPVAIAAAFLLLLAGAPEGVVMAAVYVFGGAVAVLFGGGILFTLVSHLPRGLYALFGPGKNRLGRFGT